MDLTKLSEWAAAVARREGRRLGSCGLNTDARLLPPPPQ